MGERGRGREGRREGDGGGCSFQCSGLNCIPQKDEFKAPSLVPVTMTLLGNRVFAGANELDRPLCIGVVLNPKEGCLFVKRDHDQHPQGTGHVEGGRGHSEASFLRAFQGSTALLTP